MAEITGSGGYGNNAYFVHTWAELANGDTGLPIAMGGLSDKTVMVLGTFGSGGGCTIQGSMDGTNWVTLNDSAGDALVLSAAGMAVILENPKFIRPSITAGDGTTSLTITVGASSLH